MKNIKCDICGATPKVIFDVAIIRGPYAGSWGNLCPEDHKKYGSQVLGIGSGQMHDNVTGEQLEGGALP